MLSLQEDGNCAVKPRGPRRTWWIDAVYGLVNVCFPSEATHEKQRTHLPHQWAQESGRHVSESRRRSVEIKSGSGWFEPRRWVKKLQKKKNVSGFTNENMLGQTISILVKVYQYSKYNLINTNNYFKMWKTNYFFNQFWMESQYI